MDSIQEVKACMHGLRDLRMFKRLQAILLHLKGRPYAEIADLLGCTEQTIYNYVRAYKANGLKGLVPGQSPGRPCQLTEEQEKELYQLIVEKKPADVGFPAEMNWTSFLVRDWIKQTFDIVYTDRGVRKLLTRLGFSYTKPTYTLAKADPQKQAMFKQENLKRLKKMMNDEIDRILFQDESMIRDYQALAHTWFPIGQQKVIPTYGKHHGVKLIGTLDYETGEVFVAEEEHYDAQVFLSFLEKVVVKYQDEKIVMILDNAKIHHAKLIQPFLEAHKDHLQLVFLPPYSPELNLIEGLWGWLKKSIIYNVFYKTVEEIRAAVQTFITQINKEPMKIVNRLCLKL
ncbi:IS630 family transposase [Mesobacillus subterraneus]